MRLIQYVFELQTTKRKPIIMGLIYRPNSYPRADLEFVIRTVSDFQDKISSENKIAYMTGDLKINLLHFITHHKTTDFLHNIIAQRCIPHITNPTRITSTTATLIYHFYFNHSQINQDYGIFVKDMTDHFGIFYLV